MDNINPMISRDDQESESIKRPLVLWLNQWPEKDTPIRVDFLQDDALGLMIGTIQGAYKIKEYIRGGYNGRYEFRIVYRIFPGNSDNNRLKADEHLKALADWAKNRFNAGERPDLGARKRPTRLIIASPPALLAPYEDGTEDHQILMALEYTANE